MGVGGVFSRGLDLKFEAAGRESGDGLDCVLQAEFDVGGTSSAEEALDDGLRGVRVREHAAVGLGFESHAAMLEPPHGVLGGEGAERGEEGLAAARVMRDEGLGVETRMGYVASPASGDADLGEAGGAAFEHDDPGSGGGLGTGDRSEDPGRAPADDEDGAAGHRGEGSMGAVRGATRGRRPRSPRKPFEVAAGSAGGHGWSALDKHLGSRRNRGP